MNLDWSNHRLVSFGDSFTFGDGIIPSEIFKKPFYAPYNAWDKKRLKVVYTELLKQRMGFKDSINFGLPANNNSYMYQQLYRFLKSDSYKNDPNVFVLINLTTPERASFPFFVNGKQHGITLVNPPSLINSSLANKQTYDAMFAITFDEIKVYRDNMFSILQIKDLLEKEKLPYYIFTSISYYDYKDAIKKSEELPIYEDNRLKDTYEIDGYRSLFDIYKNEINDFKHYEYKMDTVKNPVQLLGNIVSSSKLDTMSSVLGEYSSKFLRKKYTDVFCFECGHWNKLGHSYVADILKQRIEYQDYSYLGLN